MPAVRRRIFKKGTRHSVSYAISQTRISDHARAATRIQALLPRSEILLYFSTYPHAWQLLKDVNQGLFSTHLILLCYRPTTDVFGSQVYIYMFPIETSSECLLIY